MTVRYANTGGSNTSPYDTLAKGATDPQTIIALVAAGDENRYYGTFVEGTHFTGTLIMATVGDLTTGYIKHIGVNASDVVDGTKAVIDGNSNIDACITSDKAYNWFENIECKNGNTRGFEVLGNADFSVFINCVAHDNGGAGFYSTNTTSGCTYILCKSYSNTGAGFQLLDDSRSYFCVMYDNTGGGFDGSTSAISVVMFGCIIHNNTTVGLNDLDGSSLLINNVIDGEVTGVSIDDARCFLLGNRITNCTTGVDFNSLYALAGWNHFYNNTADIADGTLAYNIPFREELTNTFMSAGIDGSNTVDTGSDDGYNDRTNNDFNLKSGAENRRIEVDLEVGS